MLCCPSYPAGQKHSHKNYRNTNVKLQKKYIHKSTQKHTKNDRNTNIKLQKHTHKIPQKHKDKTTVIHIKTRSYISPMYCIIIKYKHTATATHT